MGLATARAFASQGASVALAMIPPADAADETAERFDRVNAINLRGV
jgi:NAD(P)-dependent dehydrogenase (short-subunit alcohol dehydrogenase family)